HDNQPIGNRSAAHRCQLKLKAICLCSLPCTFLRIGANSSSEPPLPNVLFVPITDAARQPLRNFSGRTSPAHFQVCPAVAINSPRHFLFSALLPSPSKT